jgi:hypothetical protein
MPIYYMLVISGCETGGVNGLLGSAANATDNAFVSRKSELILVTLTLNLYTLPYVPVMLIVKLYRFGLELSILTKVVRRPSCPSFIKI